LKAYCLIREGPHYRHDAFVAGLKAAGYEVVCKRPPVIMGGDVLVIWNRYGENHQLAERFERAGEAVLVAENGYLGRDPEGIQYYAIARGGHNGSGTWPEGGVERWTRLGVELAPWRAGGDYVLVAPNRSFGSPKMIMPVGWGERTARELERAGHKVRLRPHPGTRKPERPLEEDLAGARAVVIWASSVGVHALVAGVPVVCEAPYWICRGAAYRAWTPQEADDELRLDRFGAMRRLAWAQWTLSEIASGEPFQRLLAATN
jgi:hypothetical protein